MSLRPQSDSEVRRLIEKHNRQGTEAIYRLRAAISGVGQVFGEAAALTLERRLEEYTENRGEESYYQAEENRRQQAALIADRDFWKRWGEQLEARVAELSRDRRRLMSDMGRLSDDLGRRYRRRGVPDALSSLFEAWGKMVAEDARGDMARRSVERPDGSSTLLPAVRMDTGGGGSIGYHPGTVLIGGHPGTVVPGPVS